MTPAANTRRSAGMQRLVRALALLIVALVVAVGAPRAALAFVPPSPQGGVTDTSGKLTPSDDAALEAHVAAYRARTTNELAVLMVGSLDGASVDDVAYAAFNAWGVGKKGADNGVLLVIAPNERKMRIETGKGVGDRLTDLESSHILREKVAPLLKEERFREAILAGLIAIEAALDRGAANASGAGAAAPASPRAAPKPSMVTMILPLLVLGFCGFVLVAIVVLIARAARGPRSNVPPGTYGSSTWSSGDSSSSSSFGSSGGSDWGGGSSGGGGGSDFGGGSSGGGGSSDSY